MATMTARFRSAAHASDLPRAPGPRPYPLLRWFAAVSAVAILLVLTTVGSFLSRFVERTSLAHDAEAMAQLVESIVEVEESQGYFLTHEVDKGNFAEFLDHLARLPGVLRANVYGPDRSVLWSSDPQLIGQRFADNAELEAAFQGQAIISRVVVGDEDGKAEHADLGSAGGRFVENYLPVRVTDRLGQREVIGVVEVYRAPVSLLAAISASQQRVWWGGISVAALLYALLFVIVARAATVMKRQQRALVAAEKLATAGEMASAVAHGLRNPLASIRSTAELGLETGNSAETRDLLSEIVTQADRLEGWVRQFLTTARSERDVSAEVGASLADCASGFGPTLARRGIDLALAVPPGLPAVRCHPIILRQVVNSLLANAVEAMDDGGRITVRARARRRSVVIKLRDSGPGMSRAEITAALSPFATTKPAGLGLGLPLARESLERQGGRLRVESRPGAGTTVRLILPVHAGPAERA